MYTTLYIYSAFSLTWQMLPRLPMQLPHVFNVFNIKPIPKPIQPFSACSKGSVSSSFPSFL